MDAMVSSNNLDRQHGELRSLLCDLQISRDLAWAYDHLEETIAKIIETFGVQDVCELGGGRTPLFSRHSIGKAGLRYVVNDISATELDRAPPWVEKAVFDISAPELPDKLVGRFDFVFSRMLMEHVKDGKAAHRNVFRMLKPGGAYFHFHPVLYSPAMVFNWVMPEWLTARILLLLQPDRHDEGYPKFPAKYSYCVVNETTHAMLRGLGFRQVAMVPFYGNEYLKRLPLLQRLEDAMSNYARRAGRTHLASLCYNIGIK